jgi:TPR repeat protein
MRNIGTFSMTLIGSLAVACSPKAAPSAPQAPAADHHAAECRDGVACFELGARYFAGAEPAPGVQASELRQAAAYFEASCELGYKRGCNVAGNLYRRGHGVPRDLVTARSFYVRACVDDETTPEACFNLSRVQSELEAHP